MLIVEVLVGGLTLGGIYALIALGLTLQYGVARIMNLAHGEVMIAASFATYALFGAGVLNPLAAFALALPVGFALQWLLYRGLLAPLVRRAATPAALEVDSILATFGLLFVIEGVLLVLFGGGYQSYGFLAQGVSVGGTPVAANRLLAAGVAAALCVAVYGGLAWTRWGTAMRAMANAPRFAHLVGIDPRAMAALAFALGGALVIGAGVLVSMFLPFSTSQGVAFTMKALVIVILGGVGNVMGCLAAALLLAFVETLVARFIDPGLTLAATFLIFLLVLLVRPQGLFARRVAR
ncbi:branched-chain amino acid ABC transporter permease [Aquabacterium sp.]|uniref:branched-chain amino acid ABC transporter permease n=1 Tax=Aquabacterium sp. TaxID=1872578 RepID=UPI002D08C1EC|nr:branched-chain amino acid ABC transporter permease [Aquabacterium sp.]HSW08461.1 branched-chain amino acid ABC transporter permease [Aquabacterium sp.]